jgi:hypothetical protein
VYHVAYCSNPIGHWVHSWMKIPMKIKENKKSDKIPYLYNPLSILHHPVVEEHFQF